LSDGTWHYAAGRYGTNQRPDGVTVSVFTAVSEAGSGVAA